MAPGLEGVKGQLERKAKGLWGPEQGLHNAGPAGKTHNCVFFDLYGTTQCPVRCVCQGVSLIIFLL